MSIFSEDYSSNGISHLGSGFNDILAIVLDSPRETSLNSDASDISESNIIQVSSFSFNLNQNSVDNIRYLGEGADQSMLSIGQISIAATAKTFLMQNNFGWVLPVFNRIWDRTKYSIWGTPTAIKANLSTNVSAGANTLVVDNISDFATLPTPFLLKIIPETENAENVYVTTVNKSNKTLSLSTSTAYPHTAEQTQVATLPNNTNFAPEREPAFSLFSLREGMLSPCLVDKITITANVNEDVSVEIDFKALGVYRDKQIEMKEQRQQIVNAFSSLDSTSRIINGTNVKLSLSSANNGNFGLPTALGDQLFAGFQGLDIPGFVVTGITLNINNQLKEIYSLHSINRNIQLRRRENTYPYALYSEGRIISGTIRYKSPIDFWNVLERLAGPSSINGGGLSIDFGNFKITINEIAWKPSTSNSDMTSQTREISFTMISETRNSMPNLEFSNQV
jgi:hypothetical protein